MRCSHPAEGLSPPTRGSLAPALADRGVVGSIPAHAGKPVSPSRQPRERGVYPRPRGEASRAATSYPPDQGLSPPTRGSRTGSNGRDLRRRSIPAHAGKPERKVRSGPSSRVYPRPRGEAAGSEQERLRLGGLSPPTRGSPRRGADPVERRRSIPAHAGKPPRRRASTRRSRVYPRPRGEAPSGTESPGPAAGLSPPTRGSPLAFLRHRVAPGSIPAHAGKPAAA